MERPHDGDADQQASAGGLAHVGRDALELPVRAAARTARLAALPVSAAGRRALGLGKRLGGKPAEVVSAELQQRTAEQIFQTLGELKGGAMKLGQAFSVFEAALPEHIVGPYRAALTKLQESAPAMPEELVVGALVAEFGDGWRNRFTEFSMRPAAAASLGQVHRATLADGTDVAVKIQYPGALEALRSDLKQVRRMGRLAGLLLPGLDARPLLEELCDRALDETDYPLEAQAQQAFADAYRDDARVVVPDVVEVGQRVLISTWLPGTPLATIIREGTGDERDAAGRAFAHFLFSGPGRVGMLHADPHPGNFRMTADGRLGVLDFGAVARMPDGIPPAIGHAVRAALHGDAEFVRETLRGEGFLRPGVDVEAEALLGFLSPFIEPARVEEFHFTRDWMRAQFHRLHDRDHPDHRLPLKLNLPPGYLLIDRVWMAGIGVLSQLDATVPMRAELDRWLPGFASSDPPREQPAAREAQAADGDSVA